MGHHSLSADLESIIHRAIKAAFHQVCSGASRDFQSPCCGNLRNYHDSVIHSGTNSVGQWLFAGYACGPIGLLDVLLAWHSNARARLSATKPAASTLFTGVTVNKTSKAAANAGAPDLEAARAVARYLGTEHHELIYTAHRIMKEEHEQW